MKVVTKRLLEISVILLIPAVAFAAEGHAEHHVEGAAALIPFWINFLIYIAFLFFITRKPVLNLWASRRERIEIAVGGSKAELDAAQSELRQVNAKLSGFQTECARLTTEVENDTKGECEELNRSAKLKADRVAARAKESIRSEQKSAETKLQREVAELAFKLARERLSSSTNIESDRRLREASLNSIKSLVN